MNSKEFMAARLVLKKKIAKLSREYSRLHPDLPQAGSLRAATPKDIVAGAMIWQLDCDDGQPHWQIIEEVRNPKCDFKAFVAEDGCRYGLYDCWVEREP